MWNVTAEEYITKAITTRGTDGQHLAKPPDQLGGRPARGGAR
jgi:hypothetical protein